MIIPIWLFVLICIVFAVFFAAILFSVFYLWYEYDKQYSDSPL